MRVIPAQLDERLWFPSPRNALRGNLAGLVAVGGDLSVPRLLLAYRSGIFPWTARPITWWSPDPRAIFELTPAGFHVPRSLARVLRQSRFEITINRAFAEVIAGCSRPHEPGRWITREFIQAYTRLHQEGHAHSVEAWHNGQLAGGIYGVATGGLFAGESMFHREDEASKVVLFHLHQRLRERGFSLFDIQMITPITGRLGAIEISRDEYLRRVQIADGKECRFA